MRRRVERTEGFPAEAGRVGRQRLLLQVEEEDLAGRALGGALAHHEDAPRASSHTSAGVAGALDRHGRENAAERLVPGTRRPRHPWASPVWSPSCYARREKCWRMREGGTCERGQRQTQKGRRRPCWHSCERGSRCPCSTDRGCHLMPLGSSARPQSCWLDTLSALRRHPDRLLGDPASRSLGRCTQVADPRTQSDASRRRCQRMARDAATPWSGSHCTALLDADGVVLSVEETVRRNNGAVGTRAP